MNKNYIEYMKAKDYSENTIKAYAKYTEDFLTHVNKPDEEVTYEDLVLWTGTFKHQAVNTQDMKISSVKNYFTYLYETNKITSNPAENLKRKKIKDGDVKEKPYMSCEDLRAMVDHARTIRDKAIILLMATTGLRVSEVINITYQQYLDMKEVGNHEITVCGKGKKNRTVYLADEVEHNIDKYLIANYYRSPNCDRLFLSFRGYELDTKNLNTTLKNIAKNAGLPYWKDVSNHCLRAAFATTKAEQNVPIHIIQAAMGHSNIQTTMGYIKQSQKNINKAMASVAF